MSAPHAILKSAAPFQLRSQSARVVAKLKLIPEIEVWFQLAVDQKGLPHDLPHCRLLWHCLALGAPLCALLDLLGAPTGSYLNIANQDHGPDPEMYVASFLQNIKVLEVQGRLSYGEVFRAEDLFNGSFAGLSKVLRTVERVISALEATYPGVFLLSPEAHLKRAELLSNLLVSERDHLDALAKLTDCTNEILESPTAQHILIECFSMNCSRVIPLHRHVLSELDQLLSCPDSDEDWDKVFALDDEILRLAAFNAYKSWCTDFLVITRLLQRRCKARQVDATLTQTFVHLHSMCLRRMSEYHRVLQSILSVTHPLECKGYNALCTALVHLGDYSEKIAEVGRQVRTMHVATAIANSTSLHDAVQLNNLGDIVLDDCLAIDGSGLQRYVLLFENMLLCCQDMDANEVDMVSFTRPYPIMPWEHGPAAIRLPSLVLLFSVPISRLRDVRSLDFDSFEIDWMAKDGSCRTLIFSCTSPEQCAQWWTTLHSLLSVHTPLSPCLLTPVIEADVITPDDIVAGRRTMHPKPWSVIGRKGARSESSSLLLQEAQGQQEILLSPEMLPTLFNDAPPRSKSPLSINTVFTHDLGPPMLPTPPNSESSVDGSSAFLHDLTGQVTREGNYPVAHGGFADVWKGTLHSRTADRKVAIKVMRSRTGDPEAEQKMKKRLRRELSVWQRLEHENVLPLMGTVSDFGAYTSMVCPWMENGSLHDYLERKNAVLTLADRLQLLCEISAGLTYLHSFDIVHGDISGSNVLINSDGVACLCDFGLSSIVAEFHGTSYMTSSLGGNVRWAASDLYRLSDDGSVPSVTRESDMYSYGSLCLQTLSGRVPYFYVRTDAQVVIEVHNGVKPRRPADCVVTNAQWDLIQRCWSDAPSDRPNVNEVSKCMRAFLRAAGEPRRHSA